MASHTQAEKQQIAELQGEIARLRTCEDLGEWADAYIAARTAWQAAGLDILDPLVREAVEVARIRRQELGEPEIRPLVSLS